MYEGGKPLGVRVADLGVGVGVAELEELIVEAWLDRAPKRLAQQYLDAQA